MRTRTRTLIVAVLFVLTTTPAFAGSNVFSSSNEQSGIMASWYMDLATQSMIIANMALMVLDEDLFDKSVDLWEHYFDMGQQCMGNIHFTVSDPGARVDMEQIRTMMHRMRR